ncbi:MAG TPA: lipopolysaccharide transport periplasmic protein LptA [Woeseiaceae bacterium]|nr:lipopolysaccharide transport periplasmic protein LptA [Woeseiaceae bacterium]
MNIRTLSAVYLFAVLALTLPVPGIGQELDLNLSRLPWDINAETADYDGETGSIVYTGLRFSQGGTSIEADEGRADNREQKNRIWQFNGNVLITVNNGYIKCDSAILHFEGNVLSLATVKGNPASFELKRLDASDATYAEAGRLKYDVKNGTIEFSDQARITESGNQISAELFVYNISERRILADSAGSGEGRVRVIYTPTDDEVDTLRDREDEVQNP